MCSHHDFAHLGDGQPADPATVSLLDILRDEMPKTRPVTLVTGEVVQEVILEDPAWPEVDLREGWDEPLPEPVKPTEGVAETLRSAYSSIEALRRDNAMRSMYPSPWVRRALERQLPPKSYR